MCIKSIKGDEIVQPIQDHKTAHQQQDAVSGSVLRRLLAGEAWAAEILGSLVVSVEENYHVQAVPHHDGHIKEIVREYDTQK